MKRLIYIAFLMLALAFPLHAQTVAAPAKLEMHGLVQVWAIGDDTSSTFRIRRTELKLQGSFSDKLRWQVQLEPTRAANLLQDAVISYLVRSNIAIDVGQFKVPFTREGTMSSSVLETIERTLFASGPGKIADVRDIGVQVRYSAPWSMDVRGGVFNSLGGNDNAVDRDSLKAVIGQVTVAPQFLRGVTVTSSGGVTIGKSDSTGTGNRFSAGVTYAGYGLVARSEYARGKEAGSEREGYYGLLAYRLHPRIELATRYDVWNPDVHGFANIVSVREADYTGGLTYFIDSHLAKLQVNYVRKNFDNSVLSARNVVVVNAQAAW
jgi:phosphate-selective porin